MVYEKKTENGRDSTYCGRGKIAILNRRIKQGLTEKITFEHLSEDQNKEKQVLRGRAFFPSKGTVIAKCLQWERASNVQETASVSGAE